MMNSKAITALFAALSMMVVASVNATTLSFTEIVDDGGPDLSSQLSASITDIGVGAQFTFFNNVGFNSSITGVFFDVGSADIGGIQFSNSASSSGVDFKDVRRPNLAEGNTLSRKFNADFGMVKDGSNAKGVDTSDEYARFIVSFDEDYSFDALLSAISAGVFRVGLHVTSIALELDSISSSSRSGGHHGKKKKKYGHYGDDHDNDDDEEDGHDYDNWDGSDAYISQVPNVSTVPVPAAAWLFGSALFGLIALGRRKESENAYKKSLN